MGLPDPIQLERAARLGLIAAPQAVFLHELGENFRRYLPDELLARAYPLRSMLSHGLTVALSSDAPVVADDSPLLGMQCATTRCDEHGEPIAPDEAITVAEALRAYTLGGAQASGDDDNRGMIKPGYWADFAILSANPLETNPAELSKIQIDMTIIGGHIVHERTP
jgi:predicted amidohydrolase YtcJ